MYPLHRQKVTFYAIKSLLFNAYCSNFEHFYLKIGHYLYAKFQSFVFKNKSYLYLSIYLPIKIVGTNMLNSEKWVISYYYVWLNGPAAIDRVA